MKLKYFLTNGLKFIALGGTTYFGSKFLSSNTAYAKVSAESNNHDSFDDSIDLRTTKLNEYNLRQTLDKISSHKNIGHIMWNDGEVRKIENNPELQKLKVEIEHRIIENNKSYHQHPSDFIHGLLSSHVYEDSTQNTLVKFKEKEKDDKYGKHLEGWTIYDIVSDGNRGYYGAIYVNNTNKQIVLAHRGTTTELIDLVKSDSPWKTNFEGIVGNKIVPQQAKAFEAAKKAAIFAKQEGYHLSITGHSLGAWLAELSTYFCYNDLNHDQVKAVTFDSPGSRKTYESFRSSVDNVKTRIDPINLDIVTYLSKPNFVNSCNGHVGRVYELPTEIQVLPESVNKFLSKLSKIPIIGSTIKENEYFVNGLLSITGHKLDLILETFDPTTGKPKEYKEVLDWPCIKYTPKDQNFLVNFVKSQINKIPFAGKVLIDAVEVTTVGSLIQVAGDLLSGGTNQTQYWKFFELANKKYYKNQDIPLEQIDTTNFSLTYEAHYKTERLAPNEDILNTNNKGGTDWYLSRLRECSHRLDSIENDIVRDQLKQIRDLYEIRIDRGKEFILSRSPITTPDQIREWLMNVLSATKCEGHFGVRYILENHNELEAITFQEMPSNGKNLQISKEILDIVPKKEFKHFTGREDVFNDIDKMLLTNQSIAISAVGGMGKSSTALEYASRQKKLKTTVLWINSDSIAKIDEAYHGICKQLGYKPENITNAAILVNRAINNSDKKILLIFDNVEKYEDVQPYLDQLPEQARAIVTTRYNLPHLKQIKLKPFSEVEAKEYLEQHLSYIGDKNLSTLIKAIGKMPYNLHQAIGVFEEFPLMKIDEYVKEYPVYNSVINSLFKTWSESRDKLEKQKWDILLYASRLDPDFIDVNILIETLSIDKNTLGVLARELQRRNLVEIVRKDNEVGLKLHRVIQEEVERHLSKNNINNIKILKEIDNKLLIQLNKLLPFVKITNDSDWEKAKLLYFHADKVLNHIDNQSHLTEQAILHGKLAQYHGYIDKNYEMALKHTEAAKELWQSLGNNKNVIITLNNILIWYGYLNNTKEQLKYCEQSLKMQQDLEESVSSTTIKIAENAYRKLGDEAKANFLSKSNQFTIKQRGNIDDITIAVKEKIQSGVLNNVQALAKEGSWNYSGWNVPILRSIMSDWGVATYSSYEYYLKSQLGDLDKVQNIEIAKMLIFEAINLAIMNSDKKDLTCAREFAKTYPELTKKIAKEHPEYFVDALIVKALINDPTELERLLGKNFDGKGLYEYEQENYWYQYSNEAMEQLLKLRLDSIGVEKVKVVNPNYVWDDSIANAERLSNEIITASIDHDKVLVTLNLYGKHWVGIALDKSKAEISYMDSEQNRIPTLLKKQLTEKLATSSFYMEYQVNLREIELELQKYNNCGPETIENFISYLTGGNRLSQEEAVVLHSLLLENSLLIGDNSEFS